MVNVAVATENHSRAPVRGRQAMFACVCMSRDRYTVATREGLNLDGALATHDVSCEADRGVSTGTQMWPPHCWPPSRWPLWQPKWSEIVTRAVGPSTVWNELMTVMTRCVLKFCTLNSSCRSEGTVLTMQYSVYHIFTEESGLHKTREQIARIPVLERRCGEWKLWSSRSGLQYRR